MAAKNNGAGKPAQREFVISRVFDAPRELMWKAWTEPERLKQWWGPKGFTVHTCKVGERKTFEDGRDSMKQGWTGTMEQLEAYLAKV